VVFPTVFGLVFRKQAENSGEISTSSAVEGVLLKTLNRFLLYCLAAKLGALLSEGLCYFYVWVLAQKGVILSFQ